MKARKHLRVPVPIKIKFKRENRDQSEEARIWDLSWGGVFLCTAHPLEPRSRLLFEFEIPDQQVTLEIWGTVVRAQDSDPQTPSGVGVEFDELDHESRSQLQTLVDHFVRNLLPKNK